MSSFLCKSFNVSVVERPMNISADYLKQSADYSCSRQMVAAVVSHNIQYRRSIESASLHRGSFQFLEELPVAKPYVVHAVFVQLLIFVNRKGSIMTRSDRSRNFCVVLLPVRFAEIRIGRRPIKRI